MTWCIGLLTHYCGHVQPLKHYTTAMLDWIITNSGRWYVNYQASSILHVQDVSLTCWMIRSPSSNDLGCSASATFILSYNCKQNETNITGNGKKNTPSHCKQNKVVILQDTQAYNDVSSHYIRWKKDQQFSSYNRNSHISIKWAFTVTLTLKLTQCFVWYYGLWWCITMPSWFLKVQWFRSHCLDK